MQLSVRHVFAVLARRRDSSSAAITRHITERGGKLVIIRRVPFAAQWFGECAEPIYDVVFRNAGGVEHQATCKVTSSGELAWLDPARDPRNLMELEPRAARRGGPEATCPFCRTPVQRGARKCSACDVAFVGT